MKKKTVNEMKKINKNGVKHKKKCKKEREFANQNENLRKKQKIS